MAGKAYYTAFAYGIPFGAFGIIFFLMMIVHRRVNWFLLHTILGIDWDDTNDKNASNSDNGTFSGKSNTEAKKESNEKRNISTYLYIDMKAAEQDNISPLRCIVRFISDVLASAILAIFVAIIINSLILSNDNVRIGAKCPTYDAACFGKNGTFDVGPLNCSDGLYANFSIDAKTIWCAGWVYQDKNIHDVLDTLGICGGLLGIIASIVPFVYYLSHYKNCCLSFFCIVLPAISVGGLCFTSWYTLPQGPSQLTIIVFSVAITMVFLGWCWAFWRSYFGTDDPTETMEKWWCCQKSSKCVCIARCFTNRSSFLCKKFKFYPWCCIYRYCACRFCKKQWRDNWQKYCDEEDNHSIDNSKKQDSTSPSMTPVSIEQYQPQRSTKQSPASRVSPKKVPW